MDPVRTAIVGLGYFGPNVLRNFFAQSACHMVAACDIKQENINRMQRMYPSIAYTSNYDDIINDASIELVLIATPASTHFTLAKRALEAGKHVFIEKPITSTSVEAAELVQLAKEKNLQIFVDHTFVFAPSVRKIVQMTKQGELGELLYFDSVRINLGLIQKDINALWDLAIHDLSILSAFTNLNDISTVCAHGSKHFGDQEEDVHLHLTYNSGFTSHIHVSWLSPVKIRRSMVGGSKAMVVYDDTEPSEKIRIYDRGIDRDETHPDPNFPKYRSGDIHIPALPNTETLGLEAAHVLSCVRSGERPMVNGEDGLTMVRILEKAHESLRNESVMISIG